MFTETRALFSLAEVASTNRESLLFGGRIAGWLREPAMAQQVKNLLAIQETWETWCPDFPKSGRSPGEGNGNPLQYSCLGNPTDRGA